MKPIRFKETNAVYAKNQPEYLSLPAHRDEEGMVTTCWSLSLRERFAALFGGKIWFQVLSFNKPLQPQKASVENPLKPSPEGGER